MTTHHKDNGGAAFPIHPEANARSDMERMTLSGMSLRDYLAATALSGELASQDEANRYEHEHIDGLARWAYDMADAMLKARGET
jgi:hypothetical protein